MKVKNLTLILSSLLLLAACSDSNEEAEESSEPDQVEIEADIEDETDPENGEDSDQSEDEEADVASTEDKTDISEHVFLDHLNEFTPIIRNETGQSNYNVSEVEYNQAEGEHFYRVKTWDGAYHFEYQIDPETLELEILEEENNIEPLGIVEVDSILQPNDAMQVAITNADGSEIYSWRLHEDPQLEIPIYEFELEDGWLIVDASNGEVLD